MALPPPLPTAWITAQPVRTGPLLSNQYDYTLFGLSANTTYEFQAFMTIDNITYYGEIREATTLPVSQSIPSVVTGDAYDVTCNSMIICENMVLYNGGSDIQEYGVYYTQNPAYGMSGTLVRENYPAYVCMKSIQDSIGESIPFFTGTTYNITGLQEDTLTYYRAFAANSVGYGYGYVKSQQTGDAVVTPVTLCLNQSIISSNNEGNGFICINPSLTINQYIEYNVNILHNVIGTGSACTKISCKRNGSSSYSTIYFCESTNNVDYTKSISVNAGDSICWTHCISGDINSCVNLELTDVNSYSSDILPTISSIFYCDKRYIFENTSGGGGTGGG